MRDEQLEKRIADAVQHAAPDVLDRILSSYDEQKGNVISMSEIVNTNNKRNKRRWTSLVAVAAALALCVSVFGYNFWKSGSAVDSVVLLDVNPSISLTLNTREEVISANALNEVSLVVLEVLLYLPGSLKSHLTRGSGGHEDIEVHDALVLDGKEGGGHFAHGNHCAHSQNHQFFARVLCSVVVTAATAVVRVPAGAAMFMMLMVMLVVLMVMFTVLVMFRMPMVVVSTGTA